MNKKGMYIIMEEKQWKQRTFDVHVSKAKQFADYCEAKGIIYGAQNFGSYWKFSYLMSDRELAEAKKFCDVLFGRRKIQPEECKPEYIIIEVTRFIFV